MIILLYNDGNSFFFPFSLGGEGDFIQIMTTSLLDIPHIFPAQKIVLLIFHQCLLSH